MNSIGWATTQTDYTLRRGASGIVRVAMTVTKADGSPLDTYDGWTASMVFCRPTEDTPVLTLTPTVVPDVPGMRLLVDLDFTTAATKALADVALVGDLRMTDPDGSVNYPLQINLKIDRSWTPAP